MRVWQPWQQPQRMHSICWPSIPQAEARCHRIGQSRQVSVYRLRCRDTVEDHVAAVAHKKEARLQYRRCPLIHMSHSVAS